MSKATRSASFMRRAYIRRHLELERGKGWTPTEELIEARKVRAAVWDKTVMLVRMTHVRVTLTGKVRL